MRQILVPMDFTEISLNAFEYAHNRYPNDRIHVIHVNNSMADHDRTYLEEGQTKEKILKNELEKSILNRLNMRELPDLINVKVVYGDFLPSIQSQVKEHDIDFLVMGTRDKHDLIDRWIGTNSLAVVKLLNIPVYLIPRHGKTKELEKVLVASDYHLKDPEVISFIRKWNKDKSSFIKFLHIKNKVDDSFEEEKNAIISELFKDGEPDFGFEISSINSDNIIDSLLSSAYNFGADILILFPDNQSFIQSLVFRSVSKEIIQKSNIPLLFVH